MSVPPAKKRIIFLVRHFNDIDHSTPLIDRVEQTDSISAGVYCINWQFDLFDNPNIQYLKNNRGLTSEYLWGDKDASIFEHITLKLIDTISFVDPFFKGRFIWRLGKFLARFEVWLYGQLKVRKLIEPALPLAIVFDGLNPDHRRNKNIMKLAQLHNIPTVCLPHGVWCFSNQYVTGKRKLDPIRDLYYDYYPCPGLHTQYLVDRGIPKDRILEIGSTRYCREWLKIYRELILKESYYTKSEDKLRVVLFLQNTVYNVDNNALKDFIKTISRIQNLEIVVKPHTRGMTREEISELVSGYNVQICEDVSSVSLIQSTDVAIVYGSSIAIQVLSDGKPLLYPSYIDSNTVHYADSKACWVVKDSSSLVKALARLAKDIDYKPYRQEDVDQFLETVVYAGDSSRDVIGDYLDYILRVAGPKKD